MTGSSSSNDVECFSWNPSRPRVPGRLGRRLPWRAPVDNFGDLVGPLVIDLLRARLGLAGAAAARQARLFSVGSVLHFAATGDTVWGTGINGKVTYDAYGFTDLDVRAVRGPVTRAFLMERGISAPAVYGDPALLLADLDPRLRLWAGTKTHSVTVVPNLNDARHMTTLGPDVLHPRQPLEDCLRRIAQSELVVGSSLHGLVIAESLGIPARRVVSGFESNVKYEDYYQGTGRASHDPAESVDEARRRGGDAPLAWHAAPLLEAFPSDLWLAA